MGLSQLRGLIRLLASTNKAPSFGGSTDVPMLLANYVNRTRTFNSACIPRAVSQAATIQSQDTDDREQQLDDPEDEPVLLTIPTDVSALSRINPQLLQVMEIAQEHQRQVVLG